ncbi:hypothetical protein TNCT_616291 [Trichonephila clavata]|uniref:Uncharacterized protein n=1 Tax=Trichonephila clavata TaxID=2740835 RepID=A0A8X6FY99_TRICU|nr:hypothetical protein TNCT_616291 [Trichonephila clavata]
MGPLDEKSGSTLSEWEGPPSCAPDLAELKRSIRFLRRRLKHVKDPPMLALTFERKVETVRKPTTCALLPPCKLASFRFPICSYIQRSTSLKFQQNSNESIDRKWLWMPKVHS